MLRINRPVEQAALEASVCLRAFDFGMFNDPPDPPVPKLGGPLKLVRLGATEVEQRLDQRIAVVLPQRAQKSQIVYKHWDVRRITAVHHRLHKRLTSRNEITYILVPPFIAC